MLFKHIHKNTESDILDATKKLKEGSAQAFKVLYEEYGPRVYRYCLRMLGDPTNAEDAFQETFIRIYEKRHLYNGSNFASWLFTIARNTCYNTLRQRKDFVEFDEEYHNSHNIPESNYGIKLSLEQAIAQLPVVFREVIILREYEDYSYQEIADMLGVELNLVKVRVFRARVALRKLLNPVEKEV